MRFANAGPRASLPGRKSPLAVIFGCEGVQLSGPERAFFASADPLGFILFKRNCADPAQVRHLVTDLRASVGRADAPVLIDQEGGRVARLGPPHWPAYPAAAAIAALGGAAAEQAAFMCAHLIGDDLVRLGISIDCYPVLDLTMPGADGVIGDRSWGADPATVARLGRAACDGLLQGQLLPVIKHIPGHGRATVDSHRALPRVTATRDVLERSDFVPFRALRDAPWAMTAHIVFEAIDPERPATLSPRVIGEVIRGDIGFDGVLISDDLSMGALSGGLDERTRTALAAGCDIALHCNGRMAEMAEVASAASPLTDRAVQRIAAGEMQRRPPAPFDRIKVEARLRELMAATR